MVVYKSKISAGILILFSLFFLGLGITALWLDMRTLQKILAVVLMWLISGVLLYTYVYTIRGNKEVFSFDQEKITLVKKECLETHEFKDIQEVMFNFNVPYMAFVFSFYIIKRNGDRILVGYFIKNQIKVYKAMKDLLIKKGIKVSKTVIV